MITFDPTKRARTLKERGLDLAEADQVFAGQWVAVVDERFDYGETRFITAGFLRKRMVVMVWTPHGNDRHIISMRHCHEKEEKHWRARMARSRRRT